MGKKILSFTNHNFKYAVIGVTEYSFQYDESIGSPEQFLMLPYYLLFKDVHNYHVTKDAMNNIFNERLLNIQNYISLSDKFDLNKFGDRLVTGNMSVSDFANGRRNAQLLCGKRYPDTIKEYKEIFIKYLKLCKNNNIIPIVVLTPTSRIRKYFFPKNITDEFMCIIKEIKNQEDFIFLGYDFFGEFDDEYFVDDDHLNYTGAVKCSKMINDVINNLEKNV